MNSCAMQPTSAIASTDTLENELDIRVDIRELTSRQRGAALIRLLNETTGFRGWTIVLGRYAVVISVNRADFIAHIESMRLLSPPGSEVVRYAGLQWVPGVYGYKATDGEYILIVKPECDWVVYRWAMTVGEGENETMSQAADAAAAVMRRSMGH